jgi:hypothetical protein
MKVNIIWQGDYINNKSKDGDDWSFVTLVSFEGSEGKVFVSVTKENKLPFKPDWKAMSLRGYHQSCKIPDNITLEHTESPQEMWNYRMPENGAVFLYKTKEERDSCLLNQ